MHSVILHLFHFWPKLHCILRFTLNYLGFLCFMNQFNINSIGNSLFLSLQRSRALNFIVDRFQTNNTLIYSHGLSYNVAWYKHLLWFKVQFLSIAFVSCSVYMHSCLTRLISNINNRNKLQLMQQYSQHFTFHRKLLVLDSRIRFVFKSRLKQPVHIMAFALLFWHSVDFALVLFFAEITLYSAFHFKLSWFFILYSFCNCTLALGWSKDLGIWGDRAGAPLNRYLISFFRQQCLAAEDKTFSVTLVVPHTA